MAFFYLLIMELNLTKPIVFIDLETTGLSVTADRIIEICMIRIIPEGKSEMITQRINPTIPISEEAFQTHGISNADVKNQPVFSDLASSFSKFIGNADMAGYNVIKFDIPMLVEEFLRAGIDFDLKNRKFVDVQNIFHKMEPRNLAAAYKFYCNKDLRNAHSAEADTIATYEILKCQLEMYKETPFEDKEGNISYPIKNDIASLSAFSYHTRNVDLVGHIIFNEKDEEVFNFGKYKGKTVENVFLQEPQYYDWMMKGQFPFSTKKVITSIYLRGFNRSSVNLK
jgi:DNA polymerase III subunit epsilon